MGRVCGLSTVVVIPAGASLSMYRKIYSHANSIRVMMMMMMMYLDGQQCFIRAVLDISRKATVVKGGRG